MIGHPLARDVRSRARPPPGPPAAAGAMTGAPMIGRTLGGYLIEAEIGRGGQGVVYRATQLRLARAVALKIVFPQLAADDGFRERFQREGRSAASLEHPNVIPVYEAGEADGLAYLAIKYVE